MSLVLDALNDFSWRCSGHLISMDRPSSSRIGAIHLLTIHSDPCRIKEILAKAASGNLLRGTS